MTKITITIGGEYTAELRERLKGYGISHGELSRCTGIDPAQLSRLFNTDRQPRMQTIQRIERGIHEIRVKRQKKQKRK